jgi:hypothetical protein
VQYRWNCPIFHKITSRSLFVDISMTYPSLVIHPGLHRLNDLAPPENAAAQMPSIEFLTNE